MTGERLLIENGRLVSPGRELFGAAVEVADGRIAAVYEMGAKRPEGVEIWDAAGRAVLPGFIDIHTHGAGGRDFCDGQGDSLREIARMKVREGVTTFFPTTLTLPEERLSRALEAAAPYMAAPEFAKAPRVHLEGPFIHPKWVGAQNPAYVRAPNLEEVLRLNRLARVGLVTLAVELEGALELVERLKEAGIAASCAHSAATWGEYQRARAAGLRHLTHFCNQMTPLHHREIGLVGAGLLDDEVMIELICDRVHLCDEMIALVFKLKALDRLMLVTDSMAASWLPDGPAELGGLPVRVVDGVVRLENGALAGSTLRYHQALRNVVEVTGIPMGQLVGITAVNQAQSLGLDGLGEIRPGFAADLVVLNSAGEPEAVFVDGRDVLPAAL